jgi:hypothetical protein
MFPTTQADRSTDVTHGFSENCPKRLFSVFKGAFAAVCELLIDVELTWLRKTWVLGPDSQISASNHF